MKQNTWGQWGRRTLTRLKPATNNPASRLFLRHIRKFDKLASVRERGPRISHACKILTLLRVVCFLCKRRAFSGRFPCGIAFRSHLIASPCRPPITFTRSILRPWRARTSSITPEKTYGPPPVKFPILTADAKLPHAVTAGATGVVSAHRLATPCAIGILCRFW